MTFPQARCGINWQDISTVPRDGEWVILYPFACSITWYWNGMYWDNDKNGEGLIWTERDDCGPSHWARMNAPTRAVIAKTTEETS